MAALETIRLHKPHKRNLAGMWVYEINYDEVAGMNRGEQGHCQLVSTVYHIESES